MRPEPFAGFRFRDYQESLEVRVESSSAGFGRTVQTGRKNSATLTLSTFASFVMVASEGLRLPRRIWDKWPFEKSVSK